MFGEAVRRSGGLPPISVVLVNGSVCGIAAAAGEVSAELDEMPTPRRTVCRPVVSLLPRRRRARH